MKRSLFAQMFSVYLAILLVVLSLVAGLTYMTIRANRISTRMEELKKEAREIAYLAGQAEGIAIGGVYFTSDTALYNYIQWKMATVYDDFGAYILVVDRQGRMMDNLYTTYKADPEFAKSLDVTQIGNSLYKVLTGQEIQVRTSLSSSPGAPVFTVGVPWMQDGAVLGAVFIHTPAQIIESSFSQLAWQVLAAMLAAAVLAGIATYFLVRRITRPLTGMAESARKMADGDFSIKAEGSSVTEVAELSSAFNAMVEKLNGVERSRREFVANVSHELRSPITSIQGFVQGMEDGTIPPEEHPRYLAIVSQETRRLTKLIQDLLALSRLEKDDIQLTLAALDVNEMLRQVLIRREKDIENGQISIDIQFEQESCYAMCDGDRMEQVFVNLLDNAIKFTPEKGNITLSTKTVGETVYVVVKDDGVGILPEDKPHVFDRFFTADRAHTSGKGTGLGLSICQRIMELHGQTIRLLDADRGAAFEITLTAGRNEK